MTRQFLIVVLMTFAIATLAPAQATAPATVPADGPLKAVINGVEGIVQYRINPEQPWQRATVGTELSEGAEVRTGTKSAVRLVIEPDQTITLDRLGTLQILRANFENGKIVTDVGMKYGRTRYDIDAEGREHDAKVHSPSSVLAVRGTKVSVYDQPPFAPVATSLTGRAFFRDLHKEVTFGGPGQGKTQIDEQSDSPGDLAKQQQVSDPRGQFAGRSETDTLLQASLAAYGGQDFSDLGVLAFLNQARAGEFKGSVIGALPIERQLLFLLFWQGSAFSDVDLQVTSPLGEIVSISNPLVSSTGQFIGDPRGIGANGVADESGFGQESIVWTISYPRGEYQARAELASGDTAVTQIFVIDNPQVEGTLLTTIGGDTGVPLNSQNPVLQGTVTATGQSPSASVASVASKKKVTTQSVKKPPAAPKKPPVRPGSFLTTPARSRADR